ncbi:MAG TPA: metalloregulator ArsR/SmtB family transcription factor [bacterium]|nr:metalloregulator ArsR/SmtB family transcription factor [bacterium]
MSADFFKALCDPNRLKIFSWLLEKPGANAVGEVSECCDVDLSVVSRHLAVLKRAGIVKAERKGKEVRYDVDARSIVTALRGLADYIEGCCGRPAPAPKPKKGGKYGK